MSAEVITDLAERRAVVENNLDALRVSRGASLLDGGKDAASPRIVALEQELAALGEAETVAARRQREAAAAEAREIRARLVAERKGKATAYLTNFEIMHTAATELVDAINAAVASAADLRAVDSRLGEAAGDMGPFAVVRRLSEALGQEFSGIRGKTGASFGLVTWNFPGTARDRMAIETRAVGAVES